MEAERIKFRISCACWGPGFDFRLGCLRLFSFLPKLHFQFPIPPFPSFFFPFLFLSLPLPLPSTFRLRFMWNIFSEYIWVAICNFALQKMLRSVNKNSSKCTFFEILSVHAKGLFKEHTPFRRPSCQAREEKRKFSPTATNLRRRRQRSRT